MTANLLLSYLSAGCISWEAFPGLGLMTGKGSEGAAKNHCLSSINVYYDAHSEKCEKKNLAWLQYLSERWIG
jgi:hypothetical protein